MNKEISKKTYMITSVILIAVCIGLSYIAYRNYEKYKLYEKKYKESLESIYELENDYSEPEVEYYQLGDEIKIGEHTIIKIKNIEYGNIERPSYSAKCLADEYEYGMDIEITTTLNPSDYGYVFYYHTSFIRTVGTNNDAGSLKSNIEEELQIKKPGSYEMRLTGTILRGEKIKEIYFDDPTTSVNEHILINIKS